jgi:hypothetical protein
MRNDSAARTGVSTPPALGNAACAMTGLVVAWGKIERALSLEFEDDLYYIMSRGSLS